MDKKTLMAAVLPFAGLAAAAATDQRPNIILFMVDDMG